MWRCSGGWTWPSPSTFWSWCADVSWEEFPSIHRKLTFSSDSILVRNTHFPISQFPIDKKTCPMPHVVMFTQTHVMSNVNTVSCRFVKIFWHLQKYPPPLSPPVASLALCWPAMWYHWFLYMGLVTMVTADSSLSLSLSFHWCSETTKAVRRVNIQSK